MHGRTNKNGGSDILEHRLANLRQRQGYLVVGNRKRSSLIGHQHDLDRDFASCGHNNIVLDGNIDGNSAGLMFPSDSLSYCSRLVFKYVM